MTIRNILFLFSDQHNQAVAGCYGDKVIQTPNIDRIAAEGVKFTNAYCPSPICVPSRMSTLTARWPNRQDCWANDDMLRSDLPSWLHGAGAAGYYPALIGRLHAIGPDQLHGYVDRSVGDHSPNWQGGARQSMGILDGANDPNPESLEKSGAGYGAYQKKDEDVTATAVEWLTNTAPKLNAAGTPFCLTVGLMLPHPPYVVDDEIFDFYKGKVPPPQLQAMEDEHEFHAWWRKDRGITDVSDEQSDRARTAYWGLVHRMDQMIGRVLDALEASGMLDNTLIVYASDHGDHLGNRGLWWKHTFFEESVKVPLVMRLPGILPQGETRNQVVNLVDLSQTMLSAMDTNELPHADGRSFWELARDGSQPWKNETFSEYCTDPVPHWTGGRAVQQRMIRSDNWKLCIYDSDPPQLFDLATDPREQANLADHPKHQKTLELLMARLMQDWKPEEIAARMKGRRTEKDILLKWAQNVQPVSSNIWEFGTNINRLTER